MKDQTSIGMAIRVVKDQTSIGMPKVAIVKAISHDDDPASEKYVRELLRLIFYSRGYVSACVVAVSKRLGKTRDWVVVLKFLMLIHWLLNEGDAVFTRKLCMLLGGGLGY